VKIPKGFPKNVGRVESRLLGFPYFPYSVISMACFGMRVQRAKLPKIPFHGNLDRILKSEVSTSDEIGAFITTIPVWRINSLNSSAKIRNSNSSDLLP
jgi:hypothetical protein